MNVAFWGESPLLFPGGWGVGSSDNMHSGASLQEESRASRLGFLLQASISEEELITKHSPGPTKQHCSEARATPGKSRSRINSDFMGISLSMVLSEWLMSIGIQPF